MISIRTIFHVASTMADVIREFKYSRTVGRGRGILGLTDFRPCRKPGQSVKICGATEQTEDVKDDTCPSEASTKLVVAMHSYSANPKAPGGFTELSLNKGENLVLLGEHPSNEHWWEVKNEDGQTGFVPSSYLIVKDDTSWEAAKAITAAAAGSGSISPNSTVVVYTYQVLPWLSLSSLKTEEEERRLRLKRLKQEALASEGKGYGPPPKNIPPVNKPYISSYDCNNKRKAGPAQYYCDICDKQLNGPQPYKAHMASKAHKEELALQQ